MNKKSYGCLMAMVDPEYAPAILKFQKSIIKPSMLYTVPDDDSYGYDDEPHCTLKYGFDPDLNKKDIASILKGVEPFNIILKSITTFDNPEFSVVKFDVESPVLEELRKKADSFPNEDSYPEYHPHMTISYVIPNMFVNKKLDINISVPITRFKYSGAKTQNLYINI